MTIKHRFFTLLALISAQAFNASALPMTPAKQVSVDSTSISHSSSTTVQGTLEDLDQSIPGTATTGTSGTVRFSTPAEVAAGTGTNSVITPADLSSKGMRYSGATVFTGSMPTSYTDLDLSATVGTNRCFVHLQISPDAAVQSVTFRPNGETKEIGVGATGNPTGTSGGSTTVSATATIYVSLITDSAGIVEWDSTAAGSGGTTVTLLTYQILR